MNGTGMEKRIGRRERTTEKEKLELLPDGEGIWG